VRKHQGYLWDFLFEPGLVDAKVARQAVSAAAAAGLRICPQIELLVLTADQRPRSRNARLLQK
jgi:hypothetical protein